MVSIYSTIIDVELDSRLKNLDLCQVFSGTQESFRSKEKYYEIKRSEPWISCNHRFNIPRHQSAMWPWESHLAFENFSIYVTYIFLIFNLNKKSWKVGINILMVLIRSQSDNIMWKHQDSNPGLLTEKPNLLPVHSSTISKLKLYSIKNIIYIICKVRQFLNAI